MEIKMFDSELRVMDILWNEGEKTAKEIAMILNNKINWSKTTTYTVIKKCLDKGAITRTEPNFVCRAAITKEQVQEAHTNELIGKLFGGRPDGLIASLLGTKSLTEKEIEELKRIVSDK